MFNKNSKKVAELQDRVESLQKDINYKKDVIENKNSEIKELRQKIEYFESEDKLYLAQRENELLEEFEDKYEGILRSNKDLSTAKVQAEAHARSYEAVIATKNDEIKRLMDLVKFLGTKIPDFKEIDLSKSPISVTNNNEAKG